MSLLTAVNERKPGDFYFAKSPPIITQITGTGIAGTVTRTNQTVTKTISYTFKTGIYYVQVEVDLDLTANATAGDLLICSVGEAGILNPTQIVQTANPSSLSSGSTMRIVLSGYITTQAGGTGLDVTVGGYGIGVGSSYQVQIPTDSKIFIQQIA